MRHLGCRAPAQPHKRILMRAPRCRIATRIPRSRRYAASCRQMKRRCADSQVAYQAFCSKPQTARQKECRIETRIPKRRSYATSRMPHRNSNSAKAPICGLSNDANQRQSRKGTQMRPPERHDSMPTPERHPYAYIKMPRGNSSPGSAPLLRERGRDSAHAGTGPRRTKARGWAPDLHWTVVFHAYTSGQPAGGARRCAHNPTPATRCG